MSVETYKVNLFYLTVLNYAYILGQVKDFVVIFDFSSFTLSFLGTYRLFIFNCTTLLTKVLDAIIQL